MGNVTPPDAETIAAFLAKHITRGPNQREIAEAVSEIEVETQTKGSSFIKIHFNDPEWALITCGIFDRNSEGLLPSIEVEFPERTGWLWVLCACEPSNELSQANFVTTFEPKIVRLLKNKWGSKRAAPGYNTAAEFVKGLCIEAGVKCHIPSAEGAQDKLNKQLTALGEVQKELEAVADAATAAAAEAAAGTSALTPQGEAALKAKATKEPGIGAGSGVTVKGVAADSEQIATMNEVMQIANGLKAAQLATEALVTACIVEGEFRKNAAGGGLLQFEGQTAKGLKVEPGNVGQEVDAVLQDPGATGIGGMISLARKHPTYAAWKIAQEEQGSGAGKATEGASNYGPWVGEARKIIAAYGGVKAGGGTSGSSKQGEVSRGTTQNPSENSWDCINRLGSARNYSVFATPTTLFYMDGPELAQQRPAAYVYPKPDENRIIREDVQGHKVVETGVIQVPLNGIFDNTSVEYFEDHKVKGKVQKHSRVGKPQSPSEIRIHIVCEPNAFSGGEVFEMINGGPLNGRWIVVDATRNWFKDRFTQLLLEPPSAPYGENEEGRVEEHPEVVNPITGEAPVNAEGYTNPFGKIVGLSSGRIDMGVDYAGSGNIVALGSGTIFCSESAPGWAGGAFIGLTLDSGAYAGKSIYHAESITPLVAAGTEVAAGQAIARMTGSTESGWATGRPQEALAASLGQQDSPDAGGWESAAGRSFNRLLVGLGCQSGTKNPGGIGRGGSPLPSGYP